MRRRQMLYQWLRRACLAISLGALLVAPAWHLGTVYEAAGLAGPGPWARLADAAGLSSAAPWMLGVLWSAEVFGVELLDPLAGISLRVAGHLDVSMLIALALPLLLVAVLGRLFCGWICPYVPILALSNGVRTLAAKVGLRLPDRRLDRGTPFVVLLGLLLVTAIGGALMAPLVYPPAVIGRHLARTVYFGGLGAGALVIAVAFAFDTFVSRSGFCRYLCPGGALFRIIGLGSPVRVARDVRVCEGCGDCDRICGLGQSPMTDRLDSGCERCGKCVVACPNDALRMTVGRPGAAVPPAATPGENGRRPEELVSRRSALVGMVVLGGGLLGLRGRAEARVRPPGAAPDGAFESLCIRCLRCAAVCPAKAIRFDGSLALSVSDTPYIDTRERACMLCMKCTQACPTGALEPIEPDLEIVRSAVRMGRPELDRDRCLAWRGTGECRACYYVCPYAGRAVRLEGKMFAPVFDPEVCVGCGLCEEACPQQARAIRIRPVGA